MKQIQREDVISGFPFNIMRDTLYGAQDVTNHAPLYFSSSGLILQNRGNAVVHILMCRFLSAYDLSTLFY